MAIQTANKPAPFGAITIYSLVSKLENSWTAFSHWNGRRKTIAELSALSDHELADIGLSRNDIVEFARRG